jgi:hypothetical protein
MKQAKLKITQEKIISILHRQLFYVSAAHTIFNFPLGSTQTSASWVLCFGNINWT